MSSTYRALCMSHDPAIPIEGAEWQTVGELEYALTNADIAPELAGHRECELMGGRYSYPLIELYCPPAIKRDGNGLIAGPPGHHRHDKGEWLDIKWVRVLFHARQMTDPRLAGALAGVPQCWSARRMDRLRAEIEEVA